MDGWSDRLFLEVVSKPIAWLPPSGGRNWECFRLQAEEPARAPWLSRCRDDERDGDPMEFNILVEALTEQPVRASWTIRQAGG